MVRKEKTRNQKTLIEGEKEAEEAMKEDLIEMAKEGELEKLNKKKRFEKKQVKNRLED